MMPAIIFLVFVHLLIGFALAWVSYLIMDTEGESITKKEFAFVVFGGVFSFIILIICMIIYLLYIMFTSIFSKGMLTKDYWNSPVKF